MLLRERNSLVEKHEIYERALTSFHLAQGQPMEMMNVLQLAKSNGLNTFVALLTEAGIAPILEGGQGIRVVCMGAVFLKRMNFFRYLSCHSNFYGS